MNRFRVTYDPETFRGDVFGGTRSQISGPTAPMTVAMSPVELQRRRSRSMPPPGWMGYPWRLLGDRFRELDVQTLPNRRPTH